VEARPVHPVKGVWFPLVVFGEVSAVIAEPREGPELGGDVMRNRRVLDCQHDFACWGEGRMTF
jgi:hypothetical protein